LTGSFAPVTGYRSGGPHGLEAGEWTDDTSRALAVAHSMASAGWDLNDQARRYVAWWQPGKYSVNGRCFDIGITTRSALSRFLAGKDALASGDASERASGNGSVMRLAPVPVGHADLYPDRAEGLAPLADESSLPQPPPVPGGWSAWHGSRRHGPGMTGRPLSPGGLGGDGGCPPSGPPGPHPAQAGNAPPGLTLFSFRSR
jgi:hypothetical protein